MSWEILPPDDRVQVLSTLPPYPIVLVTTRTNAITVNQIAYFSFRPLRIGVGISRVRYSYGLIKDEREYVINIPGADLVQEVKICGAMSGRDGDKFAAAGLQTESAQVVQAIRLPQCLAQIEVQISREVDFEERTWFIGEVVAARQQSGHTGIQALMCGRTDYMLPGESVALR